MNRELVDRLHQAGSEAQRLQAEARRIQRLEQWKVTKNVLLTFLAWSLVVVAFGLMLGAR